MIMHCLSLLCEVVWAYTFGFFFFFSRRFALLFPISQFRIHPRRPQTRYTPGETASIRAAVPAGAWPAPVVGLSTGPATCGDLGSMQGAGGYAWVGTGTSIEIPLDNVFNTVQSNSVSPSLCMA